MKSFADLPHSAAVYRTIFGNDQSKWFGNAKFVNERLMHIARLRT